MRLAFCTHNRSLHHSEGVIGAKVLDREQFKSIVTAYVPQFLETEPNEDGEWHVTLPHDVLPLLSSGVGRRSKDPEHYVVRKLHGRVGMYLKREFALEPERCEVSVMTKEGYIKEFREFEQEGLTDAELEGVTHVVYYVRVHAGPNTDRTTRPQNFVERLAGTVGEPGKQAKLTVTGICNEAWSINNYWRTFSEVAD